LIILIYGPNFHFAGFTWRQNSNEYLWPAAVDGKLTRFMAADVKYTTSWLLLICLATAAVFRLLPMAN